MRRFRIASRADIDAIERLPYDEVVPFRSVHEVLEHSARLFPDRPALTFLGRGEPGFDASRLDYRQLLARVTQTANLFRSLGIDEDDTVAFLLPNMPQAHMTLLGGETAGRVCPINYLLNPQHIAELIDASQAKVLVALGPHPQLDIWSKVATIRQRCPGLRHVLAVGGADDAPSFDEAVDAQPSDRLAFERAWRRDAIAACFHTGGTTGTPKLAQHTHGNQIHASWGAAQHFDLSEHDVIINGFPLFHVAGSFVYGLSTLMAGGEIVLPTLLGMRNPTLVKNYWKVVEQFGATLIAAVPTVVSTLLATPVDGEDLHTVRALLTGGSPLPTELANVFESRFAVPVRNIFGMTESSGVISIEPFHGPRAAGSCGLPLPFTRAKAIVPDGGPVDAQPALPPGETGVIVIRGPNVSPGYADPKRDGGTFDSGWLVSGDLGHLTADGVLHITGRSKDIIIRGAHNIDPGEIEDALMRHAAVQVAAAIGEPDEHAGELPVAFVVLKPGMQVDEEELVAFVRPLLTERPAWPRRVTIVPSIATTAVGKIYKPTLRMLAIERVMRERVASRFAADRAPRVSVHEAGPTLRVRLAFPTGSDLAVARDAAKAMMAAFAIEHEVVIVDD